MKKYSKCVVLIKDRCRSQWPRGLRRRSVAASLVKSWVRIPPGAWMVLCCECCVLSGRALCDALITRPEEFYRLWCVVVCDIETSKLSSPWLALGRSATGWNKMPRIAYVSYVVYLIQTNLQLTWKTRIYFLRFVCGCYWWATISVGYFLIAFLNKTMAKKLGIRVLSVDAECLKRNLPYFGRTFLKLIYIDKLVRDSTDGRVTRYRLEGQGIEYRYRPDFPQTSIHSLWHTQLPIRWVSCLSRGLSGRGVAFMTEPHLTLKLKEK